MLASRQFRSPSIVTLAASTAEVIATAAATLLIALVGAMVGYYLRGREWLKEKRLAAYTELLQAFNAVAVAASRVFGLAFMLGDKIWDDKYKENRAPLLEAAAEAFQRFDRATDAVDLLASSSVHDPALKLSDYVNDLAKLPPWLPADEAHIPVSARAIIDDARHLTKAFITTAARDLGGKAKDREASAVELPPSLDGEAPD